MSWLKKRFIDVVAGVKTFFIFIHLTQRYSFKELRKMNEEEMNEEAKKYV